MPPDTRPEAPMRTLTLLIVTGMAVFAGPLSAQVDRPPAPLPRGHGFPVAHLQATGSEAPLWPNRVLTALAGGVLGAGLGFFASQVVRGDWDDGPGQPKVNRPLWALVGASAGVATGMSFPFPALARPESPSRLLPPRHRVIMLQELRGVVAMDAYEAVLLLRPQWLLPRPADVLGEPPRATLPVYLDDFRLGGVEELRGVSVHVVHSIRLVEAPIATARWGVGNAHGAIQVVTMR